MKCNFITPNSSDKSVLLAEPNKGLHYGPKLIFVLERWIRFRISVSLVVPQRSLNRCKRHLLTELAPTPIELDSILLPQIFPE